MKQKNKKVPAAVKQETANPVLNIEFVEDDGHSGENQFHIPVTKRDYEKWMEINAQITSGADVVENPDEPLMLFIRNESEIDILLEEICQEQKVSREEAISWLVKTHDQRKKQLSIQG